ncbi:hypothetical protein SBADM41S_04656 [Streptomyces badius]
MGRPAPFAAGGAQQAVGGRRGPGGGGGRRSGHGPVSRGRPRRSGPSGTGPCRRPPRTCALLRAYGVWHVRSHDSASVTARRRAGRPGAGRRTGHRPGAAGPGSRLREAAGPAVRACTRRPAPVRSPVQLCRGGVPLRRCFAGSRRPRVHQGRGLAERHPVGAVAQGDRHAVRIPQDGGGERARDSCTAARRSGWRRARAAGSWSAGRVDLRQPNGGLSGPVRPGGERQLARPFGLLIAYGAPARRRQHHEHHHYGEQRAPYGQRGRCRRKSLRHTLGDARRRP